MSQTPDPKTWLKNLPKGKWQEDAKLHHRTWLKVGGKARLFFQPENIQDLAELLKQYPNDAPLFCLGIGSNTLIRDGGIDALVVHLGKNFSQIVRIDPHRIQVGSGVRSITLAKQAAQWGLAGLGFLAGIPGSVGGALAMNAGAHGGETFDHLEALQWMDRSGKLHHYTKDQLDYGYRHCALSDGIFVRAVFCCPHRSSESLETEIDDIQQRRSDTQPVGVSTGGSTFVNPDTTSPITQQKQSAWQWIDAAGCRGLQVGDAQISEKHCNFMINKGKATAEDFEQLAETVRQRVKQKFAVQLEWEIRRVGQALDKTALHHQEKN